jgi:phosphohistidine phosphatase
MRRLILLRHAKSTHPGGLPDIDRPLAPRGRDAAALMGRYLADEQLFPDLALVSPARRTRETWDLVAPALGDVPVRFEPRIYEAPGERLLAVIREIDASVRGLLVLGHNPGLEDLAQRVVGHGDRYAFARLAQKFPTAALAVLDFPVEDWRAAASARLDRFVTPKALGGDDE